jgi:hypothetical protein
MSLDTMHIALPKASTIIVATLATGLEVLDAKQLRHILWAVSDYVDELRADLNAEMGFRETEEGVAHAKAPQCH